MAKLSLLKAVKGSLGLIFTQRTGVLKKKMLFTFAARDGCKKQRPCLSWVQLVLCVNTIVVGVSQGFRKKMLLQVLVLPCCRFKAMYLKPISGFFLIQ